MLNKILFTVFLLLATNSFAEPTSTIKWNSEEGLQRLEASQHKNDFYQLVERFQPQINPLYCGIASSVILLNTVNEDKEIASQKELEVAKPKALGGGNVSFNSYSQLTFLNDKTDKVKDRKIINLQNVTSENENDAKNFDAGVTIKELADILKTYQLKTKIVYVKNTNQKSVEKFRNLLQKVLAEDQKFILVNFNGKSLNLDTNGHISPIAAFDCASDSALILDVAGHKNGWYWVGIEDLMKAMNTKDGKNYRGYLVVSK
jgi:hypothetical protein